MHHWHHHLHILGFGIHMVTALIHFLTAPFIMLVTEYVLYMKYSKFWLFKAIGLSFFCSIFGLLIAIFLCADNSEGKPERSIKDIIKNPKLLIQ